MKNIALFIISLLFSITSFAQISEEQKIYTQAVKNLNKGNYQKADSLFTQYIYSYDLFDINVYNNLSISKLKQGDTCQFCHNLWKASILRNLEANKSYNLHCLSYKNEIKEFYKQRDTTIIDSNNNNVLFDLAITKSEVGDICSLWKTLNDTSFGNSKANIYNSLLEKELGNSVFWVNTTFLVDIMKNELGIYNIISINTCTNEKRYKYFEKEIYASFDDYNYLLVKEEIQKGFIMKVKKSEFENDSTDYILFIDTTETKSKDLSKYEIIYKTKKIKKDLSSSLNYDEIMPQYNGGEEKLYKYLGNNISYPKKARENNISGTVIITFIVEKDGSISNAKILKDIGGGCGLEGLRVVRAMPKWIPGKQSGELVRVSFNLPIKFTLSN